MDLTSPLIVAPMAGGPTTPQLVVAAADAGALGFLAAGYKTADALADDIAAVRETTDHFGVNVFVPDDTPTDRDAVLAYRDHLAPEYKRRGIPVPDVRWDDDDAWDAKIAVLLDAPVPVVSFTFGVPRASVVNGLQARGTAVWITVSDTADAAAAAAVAPDALVVQASAAGGHRTTFPLGRIPVDMPLPDLVRQTRERHGLPVVAAGGLMSARDVAEALSAGAVAAQLGTAMLLADEAGTRPAQRERLTRPSATDGDATVVTRAFTGRLARGLVNDFTRAHTAVAPFGYPAVHHLTSPLRAAAAAAGDADGVNLWAGTGWAQARRGPVASLLADLDPRLSAGPDGGWMGP